MKKYILLLILVLTTLIVFIFLKKENFKSIPEKQKLSKQKSFLIQNKNDFYNFLDKSLNGTPIISVDSIKTNRFPFIIENTTLENNSNSPILNSGNYLGTEIGLSGCACEN